MSLNLENYTVIASTIIIGGSAIGSSLDVAGISTLFVSGNAFFKKIEFFKI